MACTARPGGSHRSHVSTPPKLEAVSAPSEASFGRIWKKPSYIAKIGMNRRAAKSLPRRERSIPARLVVTNRAIVMQNSTMSTTATSAMSSASAPWASPTVTPSRPSRVAAGQAPVAEAASSPTASGRMRTG